MSVQPIIVDPNAYDKATAFAAARELCNAFLDANSISRVTTVLTEPDDAHKPPGKNPWHDKGWYWNGTLFVNLKSSRVPVKVPGFQWSFTGYKADLTAPGVLAHETGHHVHFELEKLRHEKGSAIRAMLNAVREEEPAVSGYEPNAHETFAEAVRLFILNPELLRKGRLKRFVMLETLGLKPVHTTPWREVLKYAHPKIISAAESWMHKK